MSEPIINGENTNEPLDNMNTGDILSDGQSLESSGSSESSVYGGSPFASGLGASSGSGSSSGGSYGGGSGGNIIDESTIRINLDASGLESGASSAESTLSGLSEKMTETEEKSSTLGEKLGEAGNKIGSFFKTSTKGSDEAAKGIEKIGEATDSVKNKMSILETAASVALGNIATKAVDAATKFVKSMTIDKLAAGWNKYDEYTQSVQQIMSATRETWEEEASAIGEFGSQIEYVEKQMDSLLWFADETSYGFTDMTEAIGKFASAGKTINSSVQAMMGISTWAAASGANTQTAARAMRELSQAMGSGVVQAQDWKSIENASMSTSEFKQQVLNTAEAMGLLEKRASVTMESLAEQAGVTTAQFEKLYDVFASTGSLTKKTIKEITGSENLSAKGLKQYLEQVQDIGKDVSNEYVTTKKVAELGLTGKAGAGEVVTNAAFRSTLSAGWFTADVLEEALKFYGEFTTELYDAYDNLGLGDEFLTSELLTMVEAFDGTEASIGNYIVRANEAGIATEDLIEAVTRLSSSELEVGFNAFKMAQQAKTFQDAIVATEDAVTTKMMLVFKNIFGNYEEAAELWTTLSNQLWDIFAEPWDNLASITSEWKQSGMEQLSEDWGIDKASLESFDKYINQVEKSSIAIDKLNSKWGIEGENLTALKNAYANVSNWAEKYGFALEDIYNYIDNSSGLGESVDTKTLVKALSEVNNLEKSTSKEALKDVKNIQDALDTLASVGGGNVQDLIKQVKISLKDGSGIFADSEAEIAKYESKITETYGSNIDELQSKLEKINTVVEKYGIDSEAFFGTDIGSYFADSSKSADDFASSIAEVLDLLTGLSSEEVSAIITPNGESLKNSQFYKDVKDIYSTYDELAKVSNYDLSSLISDIDSVNEAIGSLQASDQMKALADIKLEYGDISEIAMYSAQNIANAWNTSTESIEQASDTYQKLYNIADKYNIDISKLLTAVSNATGNTGIDILAELGDNLGNVNEKNLDKFVKNLDKLGDGIQNIKDISGDDSLELFAYLDGYLERGDLEKLADQLGMTLDELQQFYDEFDTKKLLKSGREALTEGFWNTFGSFTKIYNTIKTAFRDGFGFGAEQLRKFSDAIGTIGKLFDNAFVKTNKLGVATSTMLARLETGFKKVGSVVKFITQPLELIPKILGSIGKGLITAKLSTAQKYGSEILGNVGLWNRKQTKDITNQWDLLAYKFDRFMGSITGEMTKYSLKGVDVFGLNDEDLTSNLLDAVKVFDGTTSSIKKYIKLANEAGIATEDFVDIISNVKGQGLDFSEIFNVDSLLAAAEHLGYRLTWLIAKIPGFIMSELKKSVNDGAFEPLMDIIYDAFGDDTGLDLSGTSLIKGIDNIFKSIGLIFDKVHKYIQDSGVLTSFIKMLTSTAKLIYNAGKTIVSIITTVFESITNAFVGANTPENAKELDGPTAFLMVVADVFNKVTEIINKISDGLNNDSALTGVINIITSIIDTITSIFNSLKSLVTTIGGDILGSIIEFFKNLSGIEDAASEVSGDDIEIDFSWLNSIADVITTIGNIITYIIDTITYVISESDILKNLLGGLGTGISNIFNTIQGWFNGTINPETGEKSKGILESVNDWITQQREAAGMTIENAESTKGEVEAAAEKAKGITTEDLLDGLNSGTTTTEVSIGGLKIDASETKDTAKDLTEVKVSNNLLAEALNEVGSSSSNLSETANKVADQNKDIEASLSNVGSSVNVESDNLLDVAEAYEKANQSSKNTSELIDNTSDSIKGMSLSLTDGAKDEQDLSSNILKVKDSVENTNDSLDQLSTAMSSAPQPVPTANNRQNAEEIVKSYSEDAQNIIKLLDVTQIETDLEGAVKDAVDKANNLGLLQNSAEDLYAPMTAYVQKVVDEKNNAEKQLKSQQNQNKANSLGTLIANILNSIFPNWDIDPSGVAKNIFNILEGLDKIKETLSKAWERFKTVWGYITQTFSALKTLFTSKNQSKIDGAKQFMALLIVKLFDKIKELWEGFKEGMKLGFQRLAEAWNAANISEKLAEFWEKLKTFFGKVKEKFVAVMKMVKPYVEAFTAFMEAYAASTFARAIYAIVALPDTIARTVKSGIKSIYRSETFEAIADIIRNLLIGLAVLVAVIVAGIYILGKIDDKAFKRGATTMAIIGGGIVLILIAIAVVIGMITRNKSISTLKDKGKQKMVTTLLGEGMLAAISALFFSMAAFIAAVVVGIKMLSKMSTEELVKGAIVIGAFMVAVIALIAIVMVLVTKLSGGSSTALVPYGSTSGSVSGNAKVLGLVAVLFGVAAIIGALGLAIIGIAAAIRILNGCEYGKLAMGIALVELVMNKLILLIAVVAAMTIILVKLTADNREDTIQLGIIIGGIAAILLIVAAGITAIMLSIAELAKVFSGADDKTINRVVAVLELVIDKLFTLLVALGVGAVLITKTMEGSDIAELAVVFIGIAIILAKIIDGTRKLMNAIGDLAAKFSQCDDGSIDKAISTYTTVMNTLSGFIIKLAIIAIAAGLISSSGEGMGKKVVALIAIAEVFAGVAVIIYALGSSVTDMLNALSNLALAFKEAGPEASQEALNAIQQVIDYVTDVTKYLSTLAVVLGIGEGVLVAFTDTGIGAVSLLAVAEVFAGCTVLIKTALDGVKDVIDSISGMFANWGAFAAPDSKTITEIWRDFETFFTTFLKFLGNMGSLFSNGLGNNSKLSSQGTGNSTTNIIGSLSNNITEVESVFIKVEECADNLQGVVDLIKNITSIKTDFDSSKLESIIADISALYDKGGVLEDFITKAVGLIARAPELLSKAIEEATGQTTNIDLDDNLATSVFAYIDKFINSIDKLLEPINTLADIGVRIDKATKGVDDFKPALKNLSMSIKGMVSDKDIFGQMDTTDLEQFKTNADKLGELMDSIGKIVVTTSSGATASQLGGAANRAANYGYTVGSSTSATTTLDNVKKQIQNLVSISGYIKQAIPELEEISNLSYSFDDTKIKNTITSIVSAGNNIPEITGNLSKDNLAKLKDLKSAFASLGSMLSDVTSISAANLIVTDKKAQDIDIDAWTKAGTGIGEKLVEGLKQALAKNDAYKDIISSMISNIQSGDLTGQFESLGEEIAKAISDGITNYFGESGLNLGGSDGVLGGSDGILGSLDDLGNIDFSNLGDLGNIDFSNLGDLTKFVEKFGTNGSIDFGSVDFSSLDLSSLTTQFDNAGTEAGNSLQTTITSKAEETGSQAGKSIATGINNYLNSNPIDISQSINEDAGSKAGSIVVDGINGYLRDNPVDISQCFTGDASASVASIISAAAGSSNLSDPVAFVSVGADEEASREAGKKVGNAAREGAESKVSEFTSVGADYTRQVASGMSSALHAISSAAYSVGSTAKSALRSSLGIRSPSKEAYTIGMYFSKGFENAIYDSGPSVTRKASEYGRIALEGLEKEFKNNTVNASPNINISADNVKDQAKNTGENVIEGVVEGITDAQRQKAYDTEVTKVYNDFRDYLIHKVNNSLGVRSPSRVMKEVTEEKCEEIIDNFTSTVEESLSKADSPVTSFNVEIEPILEAKPLADNEIVKAIEETFTDISTPTMSFGVAIDPIVQTKELEDAIEGVAKQASSSIDVLSSDGYKETKTLENVLKDTIEETSSPINMLGATIAQTAETLGDAIEDAAKEISAPIDNLGDTTAKTTKVIQSTFKGMAKKTSPSTSASSTTTSSTTGSKKTSTSTPASSTTTSSTIGSKKTSTTGSKKTSTSTSASSTATAKKAETSAKNNPVNKLLSTINKVKDSIETVGKSIVDSNDVLATDYYSLTSVLTNYKLYDSNNDIAKYYNRELDKSMLVNAITESFKKSGINGSLFTNEANSIASFLSKTVGNVDSTKTILKNLIPHLVGTDGELQLTNSQLQTATEYLLKNTVAIDSLSEKLLSYNEQYEDIIRRAKIFLGLENGNTGSVDKPDNTYYSSKYTGDQWKEFNNKLINYWSAKGQVAAYSTKTVDSTKLDKLNKMLISNTVSTHSGKSSSPYPTNGITAQQFKQLIDTYDKGIKKEGASYKLTNEIISKITGRKYSTDQKQWFNIIRTQVTKRKLLTTSNMSNLDSYSTYANKVDELLAKSAGISLKNYKKLISSDINKLSKIEKNKLIKTTLKDDKISAENLKKIRTVLTKFVSGTNIKTIATAISENGMSVKKAISKYLNITKKDLTYVDKKGNTVNAYNDLVKVIKQALKVPNLKKEISSFESDLASGKYKDQIDEVNKILDQYGMKYSDDMKSLIVYNPLVKTKSNDEYLAELNDQLSKDKRLTEKDFETLLSKYKGSGAITPLIEKILSDNLYTKEEKALIKKYIKKSQVSRNSPYEVIAEYDMVAYQRMKDLYSELGGILGKTYSKTKYVADALKVDANGNIVNKGKTIFANTKLEKSSDSHNPKMSYGELWQKVQLEWGDLNNSIKKVGSSWTDSKINEYISKGWTLIDASNSGLKTQRYLIKQTGEEWKRFYAAMVVAGYTDEQIAAYIPYAYQASSMQNSMGAYYARLVETSLGNERVYNKEEFDKYFTASRVWGEQYSRLPAEGIKTGVKWDSKKKKWVYAYNTKARSKLYENSDELDDFEKALSEWRANPLDKEETEGLLNASKKEIEQTIKRYEAMAEEAKNSSLDRLWGTTAKKYNIGSKVASKNITTDKLTDFFSNIYGLLDASYESVYNKKNMWSALTGNKKKITNGTEFKESKYSNKNAKTLLDAIFDKNNLSDKSSLMTKWGFSLKGLADEDAIIKALKLSELWADDKGNYKTIGNDTRGSKTTFATWIKDVKDAAEYYKTLSDDITSKAKAKKTAKTERTKQEKAIANTYKEKVAGLTTVQAFNKAYDAMNKTGVVYYVAEEETDKHGKKKTKYVAKTSDTTTHAGESDYVKINGKYVKISDLISGSRSRDQKREAAYKQWASYKDTEKAYDDLVASYGKKRISDIKATSKGLNSLVTLIEDINKVNDTFTNTKADNKLQIKNAIIDFGKEIGLTDKQLADILGISVDDLYNDAILPALDAITKNFLKYDEELLKTLGGDYNKFKYIIGYLQNYMANYTEKVSDLYESLIDDAKDASSKTAEESKKILENLRSMAQSMTTMFDTTFRKITDMTQDFTYSSDMSIRDYIKNLENQTAGLANINAQYTELKSDFTNLKKEGKITEAQENALNSILNDAYSSNNYELINTIYKAFSRGDYSSLIKFADAYTDSLQVQAQASLTAAQANKELSKSTDEALKEMFENLKDSYDDRAEQVENLNKKITGKDNKLTEEQWRKIVEKARTSKKGKVSKAYVAKILGIDESQVSDKNLEEINLALKDDRKPVLEAVNKNLSKDDQLTDAQLAALIAAAKAKGSDLTAKEIAAITGHKAKNYTEAEVLAINDATKASPTSKLISMFSQEFVDWLTSMGPQALTLIQTLMDGGEWGTEFVKAMSEALSSKAQTDEQISTDIYGLEIFSASLDDLSKYLQQNGKEVVTSIGTINTSTLAVNTNMRKVSDVSANISKSLGYDSGNTLRSQLSTIIQNTAQTTGSIASSKSVKSQNNVTYNYYTTNETHNSVSQQISGSGNSFTDAYRGAVAARF